MPENARRLRRLALILGDQLNDDSAVFNGFDSQQDAVWMAEADEESTQVWSHKVRITVFLSAMRHYREALKKKGIPVYYRQLDDQKGCHTLADELLAAVRKHHPRELVVVESGEWRVLQSLREAASLANIPLIVLPDRAFLCSQEDFAAHASGRKQLRMEYFYREMRKRLNILMEGNQPEGGRWNLDAENRQSFGKSPPDIPAPVSFSPDRITREVMALVEKRFPDHPGSLARFDFPVTPHDATVALEDFIENRLKGFGHYQDALWSGQPYLYHSRLSSALNLKLLHPRKVIEAAENAYRQGKAPLNSVEGFVRQIVGWREYVRGIYWTQMPDYLNRNALEAAQPLPAFYWSGDTDLNCLHEVIKQTLEYGYAHHIQRLMVSGLFALLLGVKPLEVHKWYLAVYLDAVEWVEAPNTLGMSQYADGGLMASKPYVATGKYIQRMSNYCQSCRYHPAQSSGDEACPFTVLYWDFLLRHEKLLRSNPRMSLQVRNLSRLDVQEKKTIQKKAESLRKALV